MLGTLGFEILDEVSLIDDHPFESEPAEPADVAVQDLVVDDDDVAECVDILTVTVHDRRCATGRPELDLAGPVRLDHVRHDDQQRV